VQIPRNETYLTYVAVTRDEAQRSIRPFFKVVNMKKIYIIGDIHTVSAFRLSGVEGVVSDQNDAQARLGEMLAKNDVGIILMTNDLAAGLRERIQEINLHMPSPVVIEIPGIDDAEGFHRSAMSYISEALGIAL